MNCDTRYLSEAGIANHYYHQKNPQLIIFEIYFLTKVTYRFHFENHVLHLMLQKSSLTEKMRGLIMQSQTSNEIDAAVRLSHRSLKLALALMVLLGGSAFILMMFPESAAAYAAGVAMKLLPIAIAIGVAGLRAANAKSTGLSGLQMKAVLNDELRQMSLSKAYRNGFIATLLIQPLCMLLLTLMPAMHPLALMASMTVTVGIVVVLASLLWYDR